MAQSGTGGTATGAGDDYPAVWKQPCDQVNPAGTTYYTCQCVDFVAWRITEQEHPSVQNQADWRTSWWTPKHWGNAKEWAGHAQAAGYRVDRTPAVGAIAYSVQGTWGHVAIVSRVGSGTITVEEYNWVKYAYDTRTIPWPGDGYFAGFIHVADIDATPAPTPSSSGSGQ
jgi:surface antigen